jgi:hypothetical protein
MPPLKVRFSPEEVDMHDVDLLRETAEKNLGCPVNHSVDTLGHYIEASDRRWADVFKYLFDQTPTIVR